MIPNIIHFICIGDMKFEFYHYLSIITSNNIQKPDKIFVYIENEPIHNVYWNSIKSYITIVKITPPDIFRGKILNSYPYKADIIRMEKLLSQGGIYLDIDILTLKSFGNLLDKYSCVVGAETSKTTSDTTDIENIGSITNAVLLCEPNHPFIQKWYDNIADNLEGKPWAWHAVCLPSKILLDDKNGKKEFVDNVKIEPLKSFMPFCFRDDYIFQSDSKNRIMELSDTYTIHLWQNIWSDRLKRLSPEWLMNNDCIFSDLFLPYCDNFNTKLFEKSTIVKEINNIIVNTNEQLEGNCLYHHLNIFKIRSEPDVEKLRHNLYKLAKMSNNILEIGFNGGHSCALYLYANPNIQILSFDICNHTYTYKCSKYLIDKYNLEFIEGDSNKTLPNYKVTIKYDIIHIDGGHGYDCAKNDLLNCQKFAHKNTLLVFDDANFPCIRELLTECLDNNKIKEINYKDKGLNKTSIHRIFYYL